MISENLNLAPVELIQFGQAIQAVTSKEQIKAIAEKMGNKNQSKLIQAIRAWRKGGLVPEKQQLQAFISCLVPQDSATVELVYYKFIQARKKRLDLGNEVQFGDFKLLAKHYKLLLDKGEEIATNANIGAIQVKGANVGCCYIGSDNLKLVDLITIWQQEQEQYGDQARLLLESGGSVLSGSGSRTLIYPTNDENLAKVGSIKVSGGFGATIKLVRNLTKCEFGFTDFNLKQYLANLGVHVTKANIQLSNGEAFASYSYQTKMLQFENEIDDVHFTELDHLTVDPKPVPNILYTIEKQSPWELCISINGETYTANKFGVQNSLHQYCLFFDDVPPVPVLVNLLENLG